ncbi:ATP-binding protein [Streptomyces sp. SID8367]|uniref:RNA-binding domain-containing protein n=2 Tax=unclassified Streptomyces TaxID=2593676 RepID=UPI00136EDF4F
MPPGPLTFDMVKMAAETRLAESDDLDWKEHLPKPPYDGRWNELAKDVAAMANTRGGLLIFGVTDEDTKPVGIDPAQANVAQYAQWLRNHVQPYLADVYFAILTSPDATTSFLVIDIPASPMAPHHVYGTAAKDKDQQAAVVPYRDRDHTAWMAEYQIERAYRDRFTRADDAQHAIDQLYTHTRDDVLAEQEEPSAWFIAVTRPQRPLPHTTPPLTREAASMLCGNARAISERLTRDRYTISPLHTLESVLSTPRPGLRRWVFSTLSPRMGREIHSELHHDGSTVLAANLTWRAWPRQPAGVRTDGLPVDTDITAAACRDALAQARELARHLGQDSSCHVQAAITTFESQPLIPIVTHGGGDFRDIADRARHPRRIQTVTTQVNPADDDEQLRAGAQELLTDLSNQFGINSHL